MIILLYIIGAISFIGCVVAGFMSGSFLGFLIAVAGGISSSIVLFALARILENQDTIISRLNAQWDISRKQYTGEMKECTKCGYKYESDYKACPHCGNRDDH